LESEKYQVGKLFCFTDGYFGNWNGGVSRVGLGLRAEILDAMVADKGYLLR